MSRILSGHHEPSDQLFEWALEELKKGSRIKASKILRVAEKMHKLRMDVLDKIFESW